MEHESRLHLAGAGITGEQSSQLLYCDSRASLSQELSCLASSRVRALGLIPGGALLPWEEQADTELPDSRSLS